MKKNYLTVLAFTFLGVGCINVSTSPETPSVSESNGAAAAESRASSNDAKLDGDPGDEINVTVVVPWWKFWRSPPPPPPRREPGTVPPLPKHCPDAPPPRLFVSPPRVPHSVSPPLH